MNILLTGGAGFIGSHVLDRLLDAGHRVVVFDNLDKQVHPSGEWPDYLDVSREGLVCIEGDLSIIAEVDALLDDEKPDVVIHLAAKVGVGQSATDPAAYTRANALGTANLLDSLQKGRKPKRLVVASSMSCYGEGQYQWVLPGGQPRSGKGVVRSDEALSEKRWDAVLPAHATSLYGFKPVGISESAQFETTSIYAETKATTERMALIWGSQHGVPTAACRFFNVYGERQALSNPYTGVAAIFTSAVLRGEAAKIYEDGMQTRDFIHVSDVADTIVGLAGTDYHGPVNVGTGEQTSIASLFYMIRERLKSTQPVNITGQYRSGDVRHCFADTSLMESLGFKAKVRLKDEGIDALIEWARNQPASATTTTANPHAELAAAGLLHGGKND